MKTDSVMLQACLYYSTCAVPLLTVATLLLIFYKTNAPYSAM